MAHDKATYPHVFYIIHRRFDGTRQGPIWADLGDGPVATMEDVVEIVRESFKDDPPPSRSCLRVWHVTDERAIDRTRDALDIMRTDSSLAGSE